MLQKMTKKMTLFFALSCILSLGIGVVLGYGIQTQGLAGTAVPDGNVVSDVTVDMGSGMNLYARFLLLQQEHIAFFNQQINEEMDLIIQMEERIKEAEAKVADGTLSRSDVAPLNDDIQAHMSKLQTLVEKRNETMKMCVDITAQMAVNREAAYRGTR